VGFLQEQAIEAPSRYMSTGSAETGFAARLCFPKHLALPRYFSYESVIISAKIPIIMWLHYV